MRETKFKKTDIGLIPEDWEIVPLGQLFEFKNGLNKSKEYFGYGTPIINFTDVFNNPKMYKSTIKGLVSVTSSDIKSCNAHKGDVFFTRTSEIPEEVGMSSVLLDELDSAVFSGFVLRARPKTDLLDSEYSGICMRSKIVRHQIIKSATYTTRALTSGAKLSEVLIPLSTIHEQRKIAIALSDVDNLIRSLTKLIEKKKDIKIATMQQLLTGKKRLKGFSEPWMDIRLGDYTTMNSGGTPASSNPEYYNGEIPFLTISDITNSGKYIKTTEKTITEKGLENSSARMFSVGTIMYAMYASLGKTSIASIELSCSLAILGITPKSCIDGNYLYYVLSSMEEDVKAIGQTGTQANLSKQIVQNFILNIPINLEEQKAIATILSEMDNEISSLEAKSAKYESIKKGMMQELLTGKIRLI